MAELGTIVSQFSAISGTVISDPIIGTVIKLAFAGIVLGIFVGLFFRNRG